MHPCFAGSEAAARAASSTSATRERACCNQSRRARLSIFLTLDLLLKRGKKVPLRPSRRKELGEKTWNRDELAEARG